MSLSRLGHLLAFLMLAPWLLMATPVWAAEQGRPGKEALEAARRNPPRSVCKVGRRFYCDKYLGVCQTHGEGERDCDAWYQGCISCHEETDTCIKGLKTGTPACSACGTAFSVCMRANYKTTWTQYYDELQKN